MPSGVRKGFVQSRHFYVESWSEQLRYGASQHGDRAQRFAEIAVLLQKLGSQDWQHGVRLTVNANSINRPNGREERFVQQIRVCTHDGPGAKPVIRTVPWPKVGKKGALIKIGACGVCGTDLHILKGHWPKPLPWPFTLGHELGGVIVECGPFMSKPLTLGSKVMIPPLMPCGRCYYCIHYPQSANKCLTPVYYGRYLGFDKAPHLWGGWAEYVYVDLDMLPGTKIYKLPDDMSLRLGALSEPLTSCIRAFNRATRAGGFTWSDTVVIQGSGPIGILRTRWR
jgi:threonine dehydrogenase-like Zn-dependent dehydrogenase